MSEHADDHGDSFYIKTYFILLGLLVVSIIGPELGIKSVTLFTAFGVALIKAYLVAVRFMHVNLTPRFVIYAVTTSLVFMLLFFAGTAPDVMRWDGAGWNKPFIETAPVAGETGGGAH